MLGAGASFDSGIPGAGSMVGDWISELYEDAHGALPPSRQVGQKWFEESGRIKDFSADDAAGSYAQVFDLRYSDGTDPLGYRYLESKIDGKTPSLGYYVLAHLAVNTGAKLFLTTNFDNLLVDSISSISPQIPLVCGHESLVGFVKSRATRPTVVKVHRDLHYGPQNTRVGTGRLPDELRDVVLRLFDSHTLVVIGYGGNDGSLMDLFHKLPESTEAKALFWCYYEPDGMPSERIQEVVRRRKGVLVRHDGFDGLLTAVGQGYDIRGEDVINNIRKRADERISLVENRLAKLRARTVEESPTPEAASDFTTKAPVTPPQFLKARSDAKAWWQWQSEISAKPVDEREKAFEEALAALPSSAQLLGNFANFLWGVKRDSDRAEEYYRRALEADEHYAVALGNYALFLHRVRFDKDRAEEMYRRALAEAPNHAHHLGNYAYFLYSARRDYERADEIWQRALKADPTDGDNLCNYGWFLSKVQRSPAAGEPLYIRAIEMNGENAAINGFYAAFLHQVTGDRARAEEHYQKALKLDARNVDALGNYASFLFEEHRDTEAWTLLDKFRSLSGGNGPVDAEVEMYRVLLGDQSVRSEALAALKKLILAGVRTGDWSFAVLVERAIGETPKDAEWLPILADVLADRRPAEDLSGWKAWTKA